MYELEVSKIGEIIEKSPVNINLMFVGDSGVGKTSVLERYCKEKGIFLKTLILSQLEASETLGIPVKTTKEFKGKTYEVLTTAIPEWIFELSEHENDKEYPILFLDEFLCAQPSVMNAFLNFLTQKNVNGIDLSHVRVVAATNVGNYTFDPDTNMLARFCWFYTVNTHMNEYINDERIINNYKDECPKQGVIFNPRALKPRCQEWLKNVATEDLQMFYEGFTNRKYIIVHSDFDINDCVYPYFEVEEFDKYSITDDQIDNMVSVLIKKFNRIRKWDNIIANFRNLDVKTIAKIESKIKEKTI